MAADGGGRKISLTIEGVFDSRGEAAAKGWLRDLQRQTEKVTKETLEYQIAGIKAERKEREDEARRQKKITDDLLAYKIKSAKEETSIKIRESKRAEDQLERDRKRGEASSRATDRVLDRAAKSQADAQIRESRRAANDFLSSLKREEQAAAASSKKIESYFSSAFKGGFLGGLTGVLATKLAAIPAAISSQLGTAFEKAMNFRQMELSLAQFSGSADVAKAKIQELMKVSADTPGMSFLSAVDGQKRLQAIGFSGEVATRILTGLSKVRVLSGSTKDDFDAMLVNLVQIASGGQKVTQEIREMATRMPYLVGIIKKEFGTIGPELNKIDPKEFVERLANAAAKTEVSFASSSLAVENLQDAFDRLYIAVGSIIEQNPEVIAAIQTFTTEISGNSDALMKNESQARSTFSSWVSWTAKASIAVANFADEAQADINLVMNFLATLALGVGAAVMTSLSVMPRAINNFIINPINQVAQALKAMPGLSMVPGMGGITSLGEIPLLPTFDAEIGTMARATQMTWGGVTNAPAKQRSANRWQAYNQNVERLKNTPKQSYGNATSTLDTSGNAGGGTSGGSGRPTVAKGGEPAMRRFFEDELGFHVNRTFGRAINAGSMHPSGKAIDVDHSRVGQDELVRRIALAIEKGYQFVDERVKRKGIKQTGPHLHFEKDPNGPSSFLDAKYYGGADRLAYLKAVDAKRLGRGGGTSGPLADDISKTLGQQSDALTKAEQEKFVRQAIEGYKIIGIIPTGDMLRKIRDLMVQEAKDAGLVQPSDADVQRTFALNALSRSAPIGASPGKVSSVVSNRAMELLPEQQYIADLKVQLGLVNDLNGEGARWIQLARRRSVAEEEVRVKLQAQKEEREETLFNLEQEYKLIQQTNVAEEARLQAAQERNQLAKEIQNLEILIANSGVNEAGRYRRAWLEATFDIKDARIRANEEIIRANIRLDDARVTHSEQAKAKILGHLAEQKTQTDLLADVFINAFDEASKGIDKLFDKMKIGKIPIIGDFLKGQAKANLTQVFRGVVDKIFPGASDKMLEAQNPDLAESKRQTKLLEKIAINTGGLPVGYQSQGGGGLGSIFQSLGIGGGNGMGPGGTPMFNPSANGGAGGFAAGMGNTGDMPGVPGSSGGMGGGLGGIFKNIKGMFGARKNLLNGKMSTTAGVAGGIGDIASMAGGMIGGKWGNLMSMAGTGVSIGANFGPWGALVGGLIGGGAGLIMALMGDGAIKKLKSAAISEYGITVKDKSVLNSIKQIGEQYFGKGKVGENAVQTVQLDESKNILRNYAEATGQNGAKIDMLSHGDENWEGNQFRGKFGGFRAMGGDVRAGYDYIVGERGPEMIRFRKDASVIPNTAIGGQASGGRLEVVVGQLEETVNMLASRLESFSPGHVLGMGARENPDAVRGAYESSLENDPRATTDLYRKTGAYQ